MPRAMTCLISIDRGASAAEKLYRAATRLRRCDRVCLLHTIPSGRAAEVEASLRVLREAARALQRLTRDLPVEARLEIGEPAECTARLADEIGADLIVTAAHGESDFPHLTGMGRTARATLSQARRPVLLVSPAGTTLHRPSRASRCQPTSFPLPPACRWSRSSLQLSPVPL
jgi:nucleotide-binding universal stress UspA family protein